MPPLTPARLISAITLALTLVACGNHPPKAITSSTPSSAAAQTRVTHNCMPEETVGFSCELHDHRLLSLCASPGFERFDGAPKDNPGYAYLVVGTPLGKAQYSYPSNPYDYKQWMYKGYPTNGVPYMQVTSENGPFFFLGEQDDSAPAGAGMLEPNNQPAGWRIDQQSAGSPCARLLNFDHFDEVRGKLLFQGHWSILERARLEAEKVKALKP